MLHYILKHILWWKDRRLGHRRLSLGSTTQLSEGKTPQVSNQNYRLRHRNPSSLDQHACPPPLQEQIVQNAPYVVLVGCNHPRQANKQLYIELSWQHWSESCSFFVIFWSGFLGYQKSYPAPLVDPQTFTNCFDPVGFFVVFCCCFQPFSSVQFSSVQSVVSDSLRPHESQHARPPCPSPTPTVYSNSCPSSRWCYSAISSSVVPFSSCPQSLPASGSFPVSQLFTWGGQSIRVSASASVLPVNTQDWSPLGWTGWISLQSKRLSSVFSKLSAFRYHQFQRNWLSTHSIQELQE